MAEKALFLFNILSYLHSVSRVDPVSSITTILSLSAKQYNYLMVMVGNATSVILISYFIYFIYFSTPSK